MNNSLKVSILPIPKETENEKIEQSNYRAPNGSIGLCLSGGGSRALTCAMGQLRALHHLGVNEKIFAISSVSGGTWANTLYTYLPKDIEDDTFLGKPELDPSQITIFGTSPGSLRYLHQNSLGTVPGRLGILGDIGEMIRLKNEWGYETSDLWQGLVGHSILRHFGLWNPDPSKNNFDQHYFSWTKSYLNAGALKRNSNLTTSDFYTVTRQRPFMVFNTAMFTDDSTSAQLVPFEANFMLGVRQSQFQSGSSGIGGGFMESLGMGSNFIQNDSDNIIEIGTPSRPYTLADIAGCSSAAFAQIFEEKHTEFKGMVPKYKYFPIKNRESVSAKTYRFADGGSLDNLGINAMLARGLDRLLVGVNTESGVENKNFGVKLAYDIPPLFGLQPYKEGVGYVPYKDNPTTGAYSLFKHNQVFPTEEFKPLADALWRKKDNGDPLVVKMTHKVLPNSWFGVSGNTTVDILWMYNDITEAWWKRLSEEVRLEIDVASLNSFPHYNTITQLKLGPVEVNALAHMWCWNLASDYTPKGSDKTNKQILLDMFQ